MSIDLRTLIPRMKQRSLNVSEGDMLYALQDASRRIARETKILRGTSVISTQSGVNLYGPVFPLRSVASTDTFTTTEVESVTVNQAWIMDIDAHTTAALDTNVATSTTLTKSTDGVLPAQHGVTLAVDDILLVKDEATIANNGIYTVTSLGSVSAPWVLTRVAHKTDETLYQINMGKIRAEHPEILASTSAQDDGSLAEPTTWGDDNGMLFLSPTPDDVYAIIVNIAYQPMAGQYIVEFPPDYEEAIVCGALSTLAGGDEMLYWKRCFSIELASLKARVAYGTNQFILSAGGDFVSRKR